ncbi:MAG: hypothetical protein U0175_16975 [Caldilineaceae bacterium]
MVRHHCIWTHEHACLWVVEAGDIIHQPTAILLLPREAVAGRHGTEVVGLHDSGTERVTLGRAISPLKLHGANFP